VIILGACRCLSSDEPAAVAAVIPRAPIAAAGGGAGAGAGAPAYPRARTASTVGEVFCLNQITGIPKLYFDRGAFDEATLTRLLEDDVRLAKALGVRFTRVNSGGYPFLNWQASQRDTTTQARADEVVRQIQGAGMDLVMMLSPWPGNNTGAFTEHYVPDDMPAYKAWVSSVVERWDGDGQGDMPGLLRPIRYWEVDNEPDMHNYMPPQKGSKAKGAKAGGGAKAARAAAAENPFETPAEYAQVLVATAAAIRAAQPDAVVLNAAPFHTHNEIGRNYMASVLAEPGAAEAVSALSAHIYYNDLSTEKFLAGLDNATALAGGRPIFITETSVPSAKEGKPWATPEYQARMVAFFYGESLARGVERVCWHSLSDTPPEKARGGFATNSLYASEGDIWTVKRTLKPAGEVYQRLLGLLGDVPLAEVRRVTVPGGRAVQVGSAGWLVYDGASVTLPFTSGTVLDLLTGQERALSGPVAAPVLVRPKG
jgi:hypothetical protein